MDRIEMRAVWFSPEFKAERLPAAYLVLRGGGGFLRVRACALISPLHST